MMEIKWVTIWFLFIKLTSFCKCKKYTNYTLIRAIPVDDMHLDFLRSLPDEYDVKFWREPALVSMPIEFSISPEDKESFKKDAELRDIYLTTISEDLQSLFDEQTVIPYIRRNMETFNWNNFYRLDDIYNWLRDLEHLHPNIIKIFTIGSTIQGRDILAAQVILPESKRKSKVVMEGGIHAREWISISVVTYFINEILHASSSPNAKLKDVALTYEFYFVPVLNPDGYEFTHVKDRLWRKNGRGVDLNRNFDIGFGTVGISRKKDDEIFCGDFAFSEPETAAMKKFISSKAQNLQFYVAFHSYGQYMIIPYANDKRHMENYDQVAQKCNTVSKSISKRYGSQYTIGTAYDTVGYITSGVSGCWVKKTYKTPYVVTFELRDKGRYGFALPPNQIMPTCLETTDGLIALLTPDSTADLFDSNKKDLNQNSEESLRAGEVRRTVNNFAYFVNVILFIVLNY